MKSDIGIGETITYLTGPVFCSQPDFITEGKTVPCIDFINQFLPISLPKSSIYMASNAADMCFGIWGIEC